MEPTESAYFLAGLPAVIMNTLLDGVGDQILNLGSFYGTPAGLFEALLCAETHRKLGHRAVFPFAVAVTELLSTGVPLDSIWVGGRTGAAYLSDKNPMYFAKVHVFSGADWERVRTRSDEVNPVEIDEKTLLDEFIDDLPKGTEAVEVTAGDTIEIRTVVADKLNEYLRSQRAGCLPPAMFYPADPAHEAVLIGQCLLNALGPHHVPTAWSRIVTIAIGSTTTHVFSWDTMEEIGAFMLSNTFPAGRYHSVKTPVPPSCIPRSAVFTGFDLSPNDTEVCTASHQFASAILKFVPAPEPVPDTSQREL